MKIKTVLSALLSVAALLFTTFLCAPAAGRASAAEAVTDIRVEESEITLQLGGEPVQLTVVVTPASATENAGVTWLAENPNVVAVDYNNVAHALSVGTTVLHMISDAGNFRDSVTVTVEATDLVLEGISLDKSEYAGKVGDQFYLVPTLSPDGVTGNVVWRSSDTRVAIVNNGTVMLVGAGECTVSVRDESGQFTAACSVTVTEAGKQEGGCNSAAGPAGGVLLAAGTVGLAFGLKKRRKGE